jgi:hypothetical protein
MNDDTFYLNELDPFDDGLLDKLRASSALYSHTPEVVHQGALAAFEWRSVDEELATLLSDSADSDRLVGARSTLSGMRLLEFVTSAGQISVGLSDTGLMTGTLVGHPGEMVALVSAAGGRVELLADDFGEFLCDEIPPGPVRIELGVGNARVVTDWILPPLS